MFTCGQLRGFTLIAILLALVSCATTDLPSVGSERRPFEKEEDEKELWRRAEELEWRIDKSPVRYKDDRLEAHLTNVARKLLARNPQALGLAPRVKVILNPFLNAFALPNGAIYIHTGMLARMENEAQLAAVLGHEMTHFTHRHTLKQVRSEENKAAFVGVLRIMLAATAAAFGGPAAGQAVGDLTGQVGELWALASVRGYSRELETEADEEGLRAIVQAGYDAKEAPKVFQQLQQELEERKRGTLRRCVNRARAV